MHFYCKRVCYFLFFFVWLKLFQGRLAYSYNWFDEQRRGVPETVSNGETDASSRLSR